MPIGVGRVELPRKSRLFENVTAALGREIMLFGLQHRIPTAGPDRLFVQGGGLLACGPHMPDLYERAAFYASKVLKGARPMSFRWSSPLASS